MPSASVTAKLRIGAGGIIRFLTLFAELDRAVGIGDRE